MRVLIKKNNTDSVMLEIENILYEEYSKRGRIVVETSKGTIFIWTTLERLEDIQMCFLRNGYFDFRLFQTDLKYFNLSMTS